MPLSPHHLSFVQIRSIMASHWKCTLLRNLATRNQCHAKFRKDFHIYKLLTVFRIRIRLISASRIRVAKNLQK